jgi:hypothetical protein
MSGLGSKGAIAIVVPGLALCSFTAYYVPLPGVADDAKNSCEK